MTADRGHVPTSTSVPTTWKRRQSGWSPSVPNASGARPAGS